MAENLAMFEAAMQMIAKHATGEPDEGTTQDERQVTDADGVDVDDTIFTRGTHDAIHDMERKLQVHDDGVRHRSDHRRHLGISQELHGAYRAQMRHQHLLEQERLQIHWRQQHTTMQQQLDAAHAQSRALSQAGDRAQALVERLATAWSRSHSTALLSRVLLIWRRLAHQKAYIRAATPRAQQHYTRYRLLHTPFAAWRHAAALTRPSKVLGRMQGRHTAHHHHHAHQVKQRVYAAVTAACAAATKAHQSEVATLQQQLSAARLQVRPHAALCQSCMRLLHRWLRHSGSRSSLRQT